MIELKNPIDLKWTEIVEKESQISNIDCGNIYISVSEKTIQTEITFKSDDGFVRDRKMVTISGENEFNELMASNPIIAAGLRALNIEIHKLSGNIPNEDTSDLIFGNSSPAIVIPDSVKAQILENKTT